nr:reverse transcriptase domain-containing protein [Tanacetum cinerariifolium]
MSLELTDWSIQYPRGIIENVLIKVYNFVLPVDFVILDMPEDSRVPMILGRPFLSTDQVMIDMFNKNITLRVGDDEASFDMYQSIKRPPAEDDEFYEVDDLDDTINAEAQELQENDTSDSILLKEQVKTMKIQVRVQVSRLRELRRHLQLWKCYGRPYFVVIILERNIVRHKICRAGIKVDRAKINMIAKVPYPTNVKGVRSFLGHGGFYRRFIKYVSMISKPMTHLLLKDAEFNFFDDYKKAFNILEEKLTTTPIIISLDWNVPFELMCDASDFAVGAVLRQRIDGKFKPIYYSNETLNNAQEHYTTTEKELLVVVFSFDKFRPYLLLSKTVVYTDHSALKYLFSKQDAKPRLIRWVPLLQGFDIKI